MKRKHIILAVLIMAAILLGYLSLYISYASWLAGFIAARYGGGRHAGKPGRVRSIIISWRRGRLHMHHWVLAFIISLVGAIKGIYVVTPEIFYGFLGGLIFQGIYYYDDWHRILTLKRRASSVPVPADPD